MKIAKLILGLTLIVSLSSCATIRSAYDKASEYVEVDIKPKKAGSDLWGWVKGIFKKGDSDQE